MAKDERLEAFQILERLVNARGITYYRLSKELGMSPMVFTDWKAGRSMPKMDKLIKIARFFGVSTDYFFVEKSVEETT